MILSKDWKEFLSPGSPVGTILFKRYCDFFVCCVFERGEEKWEARPQNFKVSFFGIRFNFPSLDGGIPSTRECQNVPAPGGHWTHKLWGASSDFPRFRKCNEPRAVTLRWFSTNQRQLSGQGK
ncbi:hypothetical protein TNCV_4177611 [Trichonephila clavipes]|nr:hypothetical protein TNCV_4177611 [Trichonephila clavipes]